MDIVSYGKDFKKVYAVDGFAKEFQQLFDHASLKRYTDWLWRNLQNLERHGKRAVDKTHIEKLHDTDCNLYSIRSARSKSNPRVIFIFTEEDDEIVLLCAMLEKSPDDYKKAILKADARAKHLMMED